ncbi:MAG: helix-turn-helix transcriptional regulator [Lachnospiraceae bacterium]|nr:helix-turn-helix transcriptional regulator [Lachnospiraceae bacterium]
MSELKEKRIQSKLTQKEAAEKIGVSLRSYITYENDEEKMNTPKYRFFLEEIGRMNMLDEEHGVLSIEDIPGLNKRTRGAASFVSISPGITHQTADRRRTAEARIFCPCAFR